jgi:hypothetical protein
MIRSFLVKEKVKKIDWRLGCSKLKDWRLIGSVELTSLLEHLVTVAQYIPEQYISEMHEATNLLIKRLEYGKHLSKQRRTLSMGYERWGGVRKNRYSNRNTKQKIALELPPDF